MPSFLDNLYPPPVPTGFTPAPTVSAPAPTPAPIEPQAFIASVMGLGRVRPSTPASVPRKLESASGDRTPSVF